MAFRPADRVKETSTTTGLGTYSLAGAVTGFRTFVAGVGTGNRCLYIAEDGTDWELNEGVVTDAAPDTLTRAKFLASSTGAAINWAAGTRNLYAVYPAINTNPRVREVKTDDTSTATALGKVTDLDMALEPGSYTFQYFVLWQTSDITVGVSFNVNFTGTQTAIPYQWRWIDVSSTAATGAPTQSDNTTGQVVGAFASRIARTTVAFGTTISADVVNANMLMIIEGILVVTVAGNLELYFGSEVATGTQTVKAGSVLIVHRATE